MAATPLLLNCREMEAEGRRQLAARIADRIPRGPTAEATAFNAYTIRPRVMVDVSAVTTVTNVLGARIAAPIICSSAVGGAAAAEVKKNAYIASAASDARLGVCVDSHGPVTRANTQTTLRLFQLPPGELSVSDAVRAINDAERARFSAAVIPLEDHRYGWGEVKSIVEGTHLPVIAKGVCSGADAQRAMSLGCYGVCVSANPSAPGQDGSQAILYLAEVVKAVGPSVPVFYAGGVLRGTDIFKAIALGAKAVIVGRPCVFGAVVAKADGVATVIGYLQNELRQALILAGCPTLAHVTSNFVEPSKTGSDILAAARASVGGSSGLRSRL